MTEQQDGEPSLEERVTALEEQVAALATQLANVHQLIGPMAMRFAEVTGVRTAPSPHDEQLAQINARGAQRGPAGYGARPR